METKDQFNREGFTLIELLIATVVFSIILLILTQGIIQITRVYLKGDTITKTQDATEKALTTISDAIQFSGGTITGTPTATPAAHIPAAFCVNNTRFSYQLDGELSQNTGTDMVPHVLIADTQPGACPNPTPTPQLLNGGLLYTDSKELLGTNMRLTQLTITPVGPSNLIWKIQIGVVYGDSDLLNATHTLCTASLKESGQFCAYSQLSTIVEKRVQ